MWETHQIHILYADYNPSAVSVKTKSHVVPECWESHMHCSRDAHQHSYVMKIDIGIHPAFAYWNKKKKKHSYPGKYILYDRNAYYQVNADWLYLTCSTSESQIANLMSDCSRWNLRRNQLKNVQHCMTRLLFTGRWCVLPLMWMYFLTGSGFMHIRHLFKLTDRLQSVSLILKFRVFGFSK